VFAGDGSSDSVVALGEPYIVISSIVVTLSQAPKSIARLRVGKNHLYITALFLLWDEDQKSKISWKRILYKNDGKGQQVKEVN
jgi:hypothetical protein